MTTLNTDKRSSFLEPGMTTLNTDKCSSFLKHRQVKLISWTWNDDLKHRQVKLISWTWNDDLKHRQVKLISWTWNDDLKHRQVKLISWTWNDDVKHREVKLIPFCRDWAPPAKLVLVCFGFDLGGVRLPRLVIVHDDVHGDLGLDCRAVTGTVSHITGAGGLGRGIRRENVMVDW